jgi:hypothetical protein
MSGYITYVVDAYLVEEDCAPLYSVQADGTEREIHYSIFYSEIQRKRKQKVLKQMLTVWDNIQTTLKVLIYHGVDTDDIMKRVSKLFFSFMRVNKQQENDKKQRQQSLRNYKRKLHKIKTTIQYI